MTTKRLPGRIFHISRAGRRQNAERLRLYCLLMIFGAFTALGCQAEVTDAEDEVETKRIKINLTDDSTVPNEAIEAANEGLNKWKNRLDEFSSSFADVQDVHLGEPFLLFNVPLETVINNTELSESDFLKRDVWYFPIVGGDRYLLWIKVKKTEEVWKTVGIGGSAKKIENLEKKIKEQKNAVKRAVVEVVSLGLDFIAIERENETGKRGLPFADYYPYRLATKDKTGFTTAQSVEIPIGREEVLSEMKRTAEIYQFKGVRR